MNNIILFTIMTPTNDSETRKIMSYARKWDLKSMINTNYNINAVIARIIKTKDSDLYEKLPVVFAIGMKKEVLDIKEIFSYLNNITYGNYLIRILDICIATYSCFNVRFNIIDELCKELDSERKIQIKNIINKIKHSDNIDIYKVQISTKQIKTFIDLYMKVA